MISIEQLKQRVNYNPDTGEFSWLVAKGGNRIGDQAGSVNDQGYLCIRILRKIYRAQRLAWLYFYGKYPIGVVDHIDGNRLNNKISNLREVTKSVNQKNLGRNKRNKSGITGVMWHKVLRKWHVQIQSEGKRIHIGYYENLEDAICSRKEANLKYGFHENHGERESW